MLHVTLSELAELTRSLTLLEDILATLDQVGAGIAAIHVDAAINQLKNNLDAVGGQDLLTARTTETCPSEHPVGLR